MSNLKTRRQQRPRRKMPINDPVRRRIADAIESDEGISYNDVARRLGKSPSYVWQFVYLQTPRRLDEDIRHALSVLLNIPEDELRHPSPFDVSRMVAKERTETVKTMDTATKSPLAPSRDSVLVPVVEREAVVPIRRARTAGVQTIGRVRTETDDAVSIPAQMRKRVSFAVPITDVGLSRRYAVGDVVLIDQGDAPMRGDGVVLETDDGELVFGIVDHIDTKAGHVILRGGEDTDVETVPLAQVVSVGKEVFVKRR